MRSSRTRFPGRLNSSVRPRARRFGLPKFVVLLRDKKLGTLSQELLLAHVEHLKRLDDQGKLVLCGPLHENDGAIQILEANSFEESRLLAESDPFISSGYYGHYELSEIIEANKSNNFLMDSP